MNYLTLLRDMPFFFLPSLSVVCSPYTPTSKYMQYLGFQILRTQKFVCIFFSNSKFLSSLSLLQPAYSLSDVLPLPLSFLQKPLQSKSLLLLPSQMGTVTPPILSCKPQILVLKSVYSSFFLDFHCLPQNPVFALSEQCLSHRDIQ